MIKEAGVVECGAGVVMWCSRGSSSRMVGGVQERLGMFSCSDFIRYQKEHFLQLTIKESHIF